MAKRSFCFYKRQTRSIKEEKRQSLPRSKKICNCPATSYGCEVGNQRFLKLTVDKNDYLFNVPDGTTKHILSESSDWKSTSAVFLTCHRAHSMAGLAGYHLSTSLQTRRAIPVYGSKGYAEIISKGKTLIGVRALPLHEVNILYAPFEDDKIRVQGVRLPSLGARPVSKPGESSDLETRRYVPQYNPCVLAYRVTIRGMLGRLILHRCLKLGVPVGPVLNRLSQGESVTLDNGLVVSPRCVFDTVVERVECLVVDCPDAAYVRGVLQSREFDFSGNSALQYVFHLTPDEVREQDDYKAWMNSAFSPHTQHVSPEVELKEQGSANKTQIFVRALHQVGPTFFPEQLHVPAKQALLLSGQRNSDSEVKEPDVDDKDEFCPQRISAILSKHSDRSLTPPDLSQPEYPRITFLGTGSATCSPYRNVTAILVETKPHTFFLLDCGDATLLQLTDHFGMEGAERVLRNLRAVYISHGHSDHHLGLMAVLTARKAAFRRVRMPETKLFLLTNMLLASYLQFMHCRFEPILNSPVHHVDLERLAGGYRVDMQRQHKPQAEMKWLKKKDALELRSVLGVSRILTCWANHGAEAYCLSFTTAADKYKVVFTGDTRPCWTLNKLATYEKPADLLIHEATVEHVMQTAALKCSHSTFQEAVNTGRKCRAKYTLLTHFSQRYCKLPTLDSLKNEERVGIAFDHMTVTPQTLCQIRDMYAPLEEIFEDSMQPYNHEVEDGLEALEDL